LNKGEFDMKKLVCYALFVLLFFPNASCQKKVTKQLTPIKLLLDWTPNTNHTGLFVAKSLGMFKAEGLTVEIIQSSEGGVSQLIGAEKANFGVSYQEEVTYARLKNIPVVAIAAINQHNTSGFASIKEKNIISPKDFENKRYGGWGSDLENEVLKGLMQNNKGDFNKLQVINIGSADFLASIKRDIDFAWIFWGWDGINAKTKGTELNYISLREQDERLDYYTPILIASEKTLQENPNLVKKFLKATRDGYIYAINNPEKSALILAKENSEVDIEFLKKSQKFLSQQYLAGEKTWGTMSLKRWENYTDWLWEHRLIEKKLDNPKAFTNDFLPK
jgi:ABC-type nitrate/sulfonate/bicarbonate transport system substrate-binding protein